MPRTILQWMLWGVGLPLELLVIASMIRSKAHREFPFVFAYSIAIFLATLIEVVASVMHSFGFRWRTRAFFYWVNEAVLQALIFAAVISLVYMATATLTNRTLIRRGLIAGAILFAAVSVGIHYDATQVISRWMTRVSRDLNLCTAFVDLALWMLLLVFKRADHRLLMLSGGLGIQFTGEAIGHSLRNILPASAVLVGSVVVVLASLTCLYVWWQAFRTQPATLSPARKPSKSGQRAVHGRPAD